MSIKQTVGSMAIIHADIGEWYTGQATKFSATILDMSTGIESPVNIPFVEHRAGDYTLEISPVAGQYTIYIFNQELWAGHKSVSLEMVSPTVSTTSSGGTGATAAEIRAEIDANSTRLKTIFDRVTKLPVDPASETTLATIRTDITNIPSNPLLDNDTRLNNLDAPISSMADKTTIDLIATDVDFIRNMAAGSFEIVNNQIIFYKTDNVTEIGRINMIDSSGNPTTNPANASKRTVV